MNRGFELRDSSRGPVGMFHVCDLCHATGGHHDKACPEVATDKATALADFNLGYNHARYEERHVDEFATRPSYNLGWARGDSDLDAHLEGV